MAIGISTASLYPELTEQAMDFIAENRVPVTEIFFNSQSELSPEFVKKLKDTADSGGVRIASVHPMASFAEGYFLFSSYRRRFLDSLDGFKRYSETAAALGADYIVLHGQKKSGHIEAEEYCERFSVLASSAAEFGVVLTQENVNGYKSADPDFIRTMRRLLGEKAKFTFDVKQALRAGYSPREVYDAMDGAVVHIHISDHTADNDCMLPGRGVYDFGRLFGFMRARGYDGDYIIEVYRDAYLQKDELIESLEYTEKIWEG